MAPRPDTKTLRQIPVTTLSDWTTVPAVKQALNAHEWGIFRDSSLLVEAMGRDDRIEGVKATRLNALNGLPREFKPADDSQKALDVATQCEKLYDKMIPEELGNSHRGWGMDIGIGIGELVWGDYGSKMWVPSIRVWNPQYLVWRWDTWTYWLSTMDAGQLELHAGKTGGYKWFLYCPYGDERGWMHATVRSLAVPWLIRNWDWRDWARYSEVHGTPIRAGVVPAEAEEGHKERFIRELSALGHETTIRLEQSARADGPKFDLKLIEAVANTWEGFEKLMAQANTAIAVRLLGQNLTTEMGGSSGASGSRAGAQVHDRVRGDFLRSDSSTYGKAFKEQVLEPFCLFNFGDRNLAPTPTWKTDPPDDNKTHSDTLNTAAMALMNFLKSGMPVDVLAYARKFNVPLDENGTVKPPVLTNSNVTTTAPDGEGGEGNKGNGGGNAAIKLQGARGQPHVEAQVFVDQVADLGVNSARRELSKDLKKLQLVIQKSTSYQDLRRQLLKAYGEMSPAKLSRLMDKCLVLADHMGRHAVLEELDK